jgi:hypothetical protein
VRVRGIFDVKLTFVRMQNRLFPFDAQVYNFKQGDRRSLSSFYVRGAIADPQVSVKRVTHHFMFFVQWL